MSHKKLLTVVGARPQFIKAAAVSRAIRNHFSEELKEYILHTGQHYDATMSEVFFSELEIPEPYLNLAVGSANHGAQTGEMLTGIEKAILELEPDMVLVYGDTNSTLAATLAAAKLHIPVAHVEAGLRSFDKKMPEEINRIMSDHASNLLFVPTDAGIENLASEGILQGKTATQQVYKCGDVMYDNAQYFKSQSLVLEGKIAAALEAGPYLLSTIHRPSNTDDSNVLKALLSTLLENAIAHDLNLVLPLHPRTKAVLERAENKAFFDEFQENEKCEILPPLGYRHLLFLLQRATLVATDSGGVQKEAYFMERPCLILREQTEWVEVVETGSAKLCGADADKIKSGVADLLEQKDLKYPSLFGDGNAAQFIVEKIIRYLDQNHA